MVKDGGQRRAFYRPERSGSRGGGARGGLGLGAGGTGGVRPAMVGTVRGWGGTGPCLGGARDGGARAGAVGRLGRVLVGRGGGGAGVPAGCSTACRQTEHRHLRPGGGGLVRGIDVGWFRKSGGSSRTWWSAVLLLVAQMPMVVAMSMAWMLRSRV